MRRRKGRENVQVSVMFLDSFEDSSGFGVEKWIVGD